MWSIHDHRGPQRPNKEPKGFHRAPILRPRDSYEDEHMSFFLIICEILFCFILTFSFITFSILTRKQRSWSFSNREWNGRKKTYGIFNERAQNGEKLSKNKVGRVLVDTL